MNTKKTKEEKQKCEDKVAYRVWAEADYVRRMVVKDKKMRIYRCPFCDNFHLTSKKEKSDKKEKRDKKWKRRIKSLS